LTGPLVSVLITAYNSERYIARAVQSILSQTLVEFDLIVVDDGSTDNTLEILNGFQQRDQRLKICPNEHRGIVPSANQGLGMCSGKYIARLDADDFSLPNRLEIQVRFLEAHPEIVILGSSVFLVDDMDQVLNVSVPPSSDTAIRAALLLDNPFSTSAVMMRNMVLQDNNISYEPFYLHAEDYDLWSRLLDFGEGCNLTDPLSCRRIHPEQRSTREMDDCEAYADRVACRNLEKIGLSFTTDEVRTLRLWERKRPVLEAEAECRLANRIIDLCETLKVQSWVDSQTALLYKSRWALKIFSARARSWSGFKTKIQLFIKLNGTKIDFLVMYLRKRASYLKMRRMILNAVQYNNHQRR